MFLRQQDSSKTNALPKKRDEILEFIKNSPRGIVKDTLEQEKNKTYFKKNKF